MDGKKTIKSLVNYRNGWSESIKDVMAARNGDYSVIGKLAEKWDKMSGLERAMAGIAVITSASSAVDAGRQGDYLKMVKNVVDTVNGGAGLIIGATESMAKAGKLSQWIGPAAEGAGEAAGLASKFMPALGVLANGLATATDLRDAIEKKRIGLALAASAEGLATITSALGPEAAPITWAATTIAGAIKFFDGVLATKAEQNERYELLGHMAANGELDPDLARTLGYANNASLKALADNLRFTPEMIQDFALRFPNDVMQEIPQHYVAAGKFENAFGLSPDEMQALLREGLATPANLDSFFDVLETPASLNATADEFRSALQAIANSDNAPGGQRRAAAIALDFLANRNRGPSTDY
jgi:hypothetical protein